MFQLQVASGPLCVSVLLSLDSLRTVYEAGGAGVISKALGGVPLVWRGTTCS